MNWPHELQQIFTILIAGGLGAVVGIEREINRKPAGLRTHIFVSAGAALLMVVGHSVVQYYQQQGNDLVESDPLRTIQAIIMGISFLGAGTIVHEKNNQIEGLTTAASIFLTAGIGVATAVEEYLLAGCTALFALIILVIVGWIENHFH